MAAESPRSNPIRHVGVFAFPFGTHAVPLLSLVRKLSAAAPGIRFSFLNVSWSNKSLFSDGEQGNDSSVRPYDVDDGAPEGYAPSRKNPIEPVELFLKAAPENFRTALEAAEAEIGLKIGCLVSDAFFWFAGDIAAERGMPWIPLWTAAPRSLLVHLDTDEIRLRIVRPEGICEDQTLDFLPGFSAIRRSDLPEGVIISPGHHESPFEEMLHKMALTLPEAAAVAINSFHAVDPEISDHLKTRFRNFLNIGPFTLTRLPNPTDEHGCLEWLAEREPASVVYVSFGSVVTPPPHEAAALAEALEESGFPFLWSLRGNAEGFLEGKSRKGNSGSKGKLVPWAPQVEVLKHPSVGAFVTHCGWNSVVESVVGGVPLICRPFFGDQKLNTRTLEAVWGIGVEVDGGVITKGGAIKALRRVLVEEEGKGMRERIGVMKKFAHRAVEADGNSTQDFNALVEVITSN